MNTHQIIRTTILSSITILILALAAFADSALAHTVTKQKCKRSASAHVASHGALTVHHWRADYRRCMQYKDKHNLRHQCARPRPVVTGITVKHRRAQISQRRNLTTALNLGRKMRVPRSHQVALVAGATQEQTAYNKPSGHGTSVGFLQLINLHGHPKYSVNPSANIRWRMQIPNSAGWFLRAARKIDPRGRRYPGKLAQDVQGSAHPTLYNQWVAEARRTVRPMTLRGFPTATKRRRCTGRTGGSISLNN
jgi:hypothetical protein